MAPPSGVGRGRHTAVRSTRSRWSDCGLSGIECIDAPVAVRGASTGFSLLLVGGLAQPLVGAWVPLVAYAWIPLVALLAFGVAARRTGSATLPAVHGALAAVGSYLLVLPLVLLNPIGRDIAQIVATAAAAVLTGAVVGLLRDRWLSKSRGR